LTEPKKTPQGPSDDIAEGTAVPPENEKPAAHKKLLLKKPDQASRAYGMCDESRELPTSKEVGFLIHRGDSPNIT
jgi:hypothetical protein